MICRSTTSGVGQDCGEGRPPDGGPRVLAQVVDLSGLRRKGAAWVGLATAVAERSAQIWESLANKYQILEKGEVLLGGVGTPDSWEHLPFLL